MPTDKNVLADKFFPIDKQYSCIVGAIIGDIIGSRFERNNYRATDFQLFTDKSTFTDETISVLGTALGILDFYQAMKGQRRKDVLPVFIIENMKALYRAYPNCRYETQMLKKFFHRTKSRPYRSTTNIAMVRIAACIDYGRTQVQAKLYGSSATIITHDTAEGMDAMADLLKMTFKLDTYGILPLEDTEYIRNDFMLTDNCQETLQAVLLACQLSSSFEEGIRLAVSFGGDSDTIAACVGIVLAKRFGIPNELIEQMEEYISKFDMLWDTYRYCLGMEFRPPILPS